MFDQKISKDKLRDCQSEAYDAIIKHFSSKDAEKHVMIQLPTGTGKSALIGITPFNLAKNKVLILTPNLTLSKQLENDLDITNNPEGNIYKKFEILSDETLESLELYTLRLENTANFTDIEEHQIIISNYHQLSDVEKWFKGRESLIDLVIIDEAHHAKANTYQKVIDFFKEAKIISLTATPFRSDGQKLDGLNLYTYHFSDAINRKYIRNIKVSNVAPQEISLSFTDEDNKIYSLEDIVRMKEQAWFRKGIATSQDCCDSIASKAYEKLLELRKDYPNTTHQIVASATSYREAKEFVKPAFTKLGLKVGLVSSYNKDTNEQTFTKLYQGKIDVIVNVDMLKEGFDHKNLGVAAIFRPFATLNPYIQFIGRAIRRNEETKHCYVVSHLGLNQSQRFDEFKLFDSEDKDFLENLLSDDSNITRIKEDDSFMPDDERSKEVGIGNDKLEIKEIGDNVLDFESQFVKDVDKVAKVEEQIHNLSEDEKVSLFAKLGIKYDSVKSNKKKKVKPVDKRKTAKALLNDREKGVTTDIVNELGLKMYDRNFNPLYKNFQWVKQRVSREINKKAGIEKKERNKLSNQQLEQIENEQILSKVKEECLAYFKDKLNKNN